MIEQDAIEQDAAGAPPQHMRALQRANRVRLARAELKRAIARGEIPVTEVIQEVPWEAESMTMGELLTSQRRWGRTRARRLLQQVSLSENKAVGAMTHRQRQLLAEILAKTPPASVASPPTETGRKHAAEWDELAALARRQEELSAELDQLTTRRDELIRSLSEAGASRRVVAEAASLTVGRVQQIVDGARIPRAPSSEPQAAIAR